MSKTFDIDNLKFKIYGTRGRRYPTHWADRFVKKPTYKGLKLLGGNKLRKKRLRKKRMTSLVARYPIRHVDYSFKLNQYPNYVAQQAYIRESWGCPCLSTKDMDLVMNRIMEEIERSAREEANEKFHPFRHSSGAGQQNPGNVPVSDASSGDEELLGRPTRNEV